MHCEEQQNEVNRMSEARNFLQNGDVEWFQGRQSHETTGIGI